MPGLRAIAAGQWQGFLRELFESYAAKHFCSEGRHKEEIVKKWIFCVATMLVLCCGVAKADALHDANVAYENGDYVQAIRLWRPMAEKGNALAQYNLGAIYGNGYGVTRDNQEALKWFRLAAAQGFADAQFRLGFMYADGNGVTQDNQEALKWWRLAAAQGIAEAQFMLGYKYANGYGVTQDKQEAVKWQRLAAAQGFVGAQDNPSALYKKGQAEHNPFAHPVLRAATPAASTPIGEVNLYPQAADVNTAQPQTESRRGSLLNRIVQGAIGGLMLGVIAGLFILVRFLIRKAKAPAKSATALTAAVGTTAMQRVKQRMDDYVEGIKECPFCKETVKARAVVCKHCHRDI